MQAVDGRLICQASEVSLGHAHGQHPLTGGGEADTHVRMGRSPLACSTHSAALMQIALRCSSGKGLPWELFISRLHRQTQSLKVKIIHFFTGESMSHDVLAYYDFT